MLSSLMESCKYSSLCPPIYVRCEGHDKPPPGGYSCELGSTKFFLISGFCGIFACGVTHTGIVPLDLVKCRIQTNPDKYKNILHGFSVTIKEDGVLSLRRGWVPTAIGYSLQGLGKFGLYEYFRFKYSEMIGEELAYSWRTTVYLVASASAEFFADIALCPMEACKVRIQTQEGSSPHLRVVVPTIYKEEGFMGFYKGITPLWLRQVPYTMVKFSTFERTVEAIYKYILSKPKDDYSKPAQLGVSFIGGYAAGVLCALISHPADTVVSKLNQDKGSTAIEAARKLGWQGLWKGLTPRIVMIGTLTALQWFIYDGMKVWLRLPRPPPPHGPDNPKKEFKEDHKK